MLKNTINHFWKKKQKTIDGTIKNIYTRTKKIRKPKDY